MTSNCNGEVKCCKSTLDCKATAALQEKVEAEMQDEDKSLKELLNGKENPSDPATSG